MHKRRRIIDDIKGQLKSSGQFGGVWTQRTPPRSNYPAVNIYAESETTQTEYAQQAPRLQERTLILAVECWVKDSNVDEKAERDMDAMADIIEQILMRPADALDSSLISTAFAVDEDDPGLIVLTLNYQIDYCTVENNPTT
ncbi:MAG: hypothetical protein C0509_07975 [Acinetobacter sp.]|nr:hypothetical protein [Acinetobacter sp.]